LKTGGRNLGVYWLWRDTNPCTLDQSGINHSLI